MRRWLAIIPLLYAPAAWADSIIVTNDTDHIQAVGVEFNDKDFVVKIKPHSYHILRGRGLILIRDGEGPFTTQDKEEYTIMRNNRLVLTRPAPVKTKEE